MDRRLLFPALAMTAVAQTTSPASAKAEKALRARAEEFYKLEIAKNRQAETLVAQESKDYFYNSGKPNLKDVKIGNIEFTDNGKKAIVHIYATVQLMAPELGQQNFSAPATSTWKLEKGQWFWYVDENAPVATPFGNMKPGPGGGGGGSMMDLAKKPSAASIESLVTVDRQNVTLTAGVPDQTVTISNGLPGPITLAVGGKRIDGVAAELDKKDIEGGGKAVLHVRRTGDANGGGIIVLTASPLNLEFDIQVVQK